MTQNPGRKLWAMIQTPGDGQRLVKRAKPVTRTGELANQIIMQEKRAVCLWPPVEYGLMRPVVDSGVLFVTVVRKDLILRILLTDLQRCKEY